MRYRIVTAGGRTAYPFDVASEEEAIDLAYATIRKFRDRIQPADLPFRVIQVGKPHLGRSISPPPNGKRR